MKDSKTMLLMAAVAILMGGAGFFGGTLYQKNITPRYGENGRIGANMMGRGAGGFNGTNTGGLGGQRTGGMGFRPVVGNIISQDGKSITIQLTDGSSKIVLLSDTTVINKAEKVDASALVAGEVVRVFGTTNSDGSVTAQDIQLNPEQAQRGQSQ
jgi:hypothetical protein